MKIRRTVCGTATAIGLLLGATACGGDTTTQPRADQPLVTPTTPKPTPTRVDPTAAAKAKIMADYKLFVETRARGQVTNIPTFPYEQVMTGNALATQKSVVAGAELAGMKYSGSVRFLTGEVSALNLKAKPSTATVRACIFDGLKATSKRGKVKVLQDKLSREDQMVLVDGRWKATETKSFVKSVGGCA